MSEIVRILVVDDHPLLREGFSSLVSYQDDMVVIGEAGNGDEAVTQWRTLRPDVILMDLVMPQKDGIEAIKEIIEEDHEARILVLTSFMEDEKVFAAIKAGALGYVLKDSAPEELLRAIKDVHKGHHSLHPVIARKLVNELSHSWNNDGEDRSHELSDIHEESPLSVLTKREIETLKLMTRGLSNKEVAEVLAVSQATVRSHISSILNKLHLSNRTRAVLYALREGLVDLDETFDQF